MTTFPLFDWKAERDAALATVERNAGEQFREDARRFVIDYLRSNTQASGEEITDACKRAGIIPHSDKAFGPVYLALSRRGIIEICGSVKRLRGHGCSGGNLWRLKL